MNMKKISKFDLTGNDMSWYFDDKSIQISYPNVEQAIANENQGYILILLKGEDLPGKLIVLDGAGKEIENITSIDGFKLYYLSSHPKTEVSIVCISDSPVDDFTDWHFGYDMKDHQFVRLNRAY
jgi:hypothetical protein